MISRTLPEDMPPRATFPQSPGEVWALGLARIVEDLGSEGVLNEGQVTSLMVRLEALKKALESEKANGPRVLDSFVKEVEGLVSGCVLTSDRAQPLIRGATAITWYI